MPRALNKHGFKGVFKHGSKQHARKPFYARVRKNDKQFVSKHFETPAQAAKEYRRLKSRLTNYVQ